MSYMKYKNVKIQLKMIIFVHLMKKLTNGYSIRKYNQSILMFNHTSENMIQIQIKNFLIKKNGQILLVLKMESILMLDID